MTIFKNLKAGIGKMARATGNVAGSVAKSVGGHIYRNRDLYAKALGSAGKVATGYAVGGLPGAAIAVGNESKDIKDTIVEAGKRVIGKGKPVGQRKIAKADINKVAENVIAPIAKKKIGSERLKLIKSLAQGQSV